ncbi:MAG: hypothetical protein ABJ308_16840 [Halieaceae bacterium]
MSRHTGGYILVATIWVLAFLGIAAASIAQWYGKSLQLAGNRVDASNGGIAELSTRATLLYKIATADIGRAGVFLSPAADEESVISGFARIRAGRADLIFDGVAYQGYGFTRFAIQDESGLYGIVPQATGRTQALLAQHGVDYREAEVMAARLADYVDADDLVSINGAEARDYRSRGLPPPRNRRLESPHELQAVMGWSEHRDLWADNAFANRVSLSWAGMPNSATAPEDVLLRMRGATPERVAGLIAQRHGSDEVDDEVNSWIRDLVANNEFGSTPRPSLGLRMRFWHEGEGQLREYAVKFTPGNQAPAPWIIENNYRQPLPKGYLSETARTAQLPDFVL